MMANAMPWPGTARSFPHSEPKEGRTRSENEDSHEANKALGRYAVADGASTAARSEVWSRLLTRSFVVEKRDPLCSHTLTDLRTRWWNTVSGGSLPWFARTKLLEGSAATFLGLALDPERFHARAVGDSCLFHLRGDNLLSGGPLERSEQFTRSPPLVYTHPSRELLNDDVWVSQGTYCRGDTFVLATDAAAKYLLRQYETNGTMSSLLQSGNDSAVFRSRVCELRSTGQLDNDDTTVCVIWT